jgi:predicted ATPase/DNA-binding XRE family transcriptional regulator
LRRLRQAAGLTQEALAERAGLSPNAIGQLERGARQHPYPHTVRALAEALGLSAEDEARLHASVPLRAGPEPPAPAHPRVFAVAAPLTDVVGREQETARLAALVTRVRLVTLTGPGGVGKSRLAVAVATRLAAAFPDGLIFVDLAPLADPGLVVPAIADALGVREAGAQALQSLLLARLRDRRLLLLLDNVEHLLAAAPQIAALLGGCPALHVLATSREALRLRGEQEFPVHPLPLPDLAHPPGLDEVSDAASVRLFVQRARDVLPNFELTRENVGAAAAICRRLDGLPLAIELAAARIKVLPLPALLERLDRAMPVLVGGARDLPARQRTMRAAVGWSYDLLAAPEQALFRRLSVFAGGWTLSGAGAMADGLGAGGALELLSGLLDRSLVLADTLAAAADPRYRMLEPIRQYALERLEAADEERETRGRHAALHLALAEHAALALRGAGQVESLERLDREGDNLRAAMRWYLDRRAWDAVARLGWALWLFWVYRGHLSVGRAWMREALSGGQDATTLTRARLLFVAGVMAYHQRDHAAATADLEQSLQLFRPCGDQLGVAQALSRLGVIALGRGQHRRAEGLLDEAARAFRAADDAWDAAVATVQLAVAVRRLGDTGRAARLSEASLAAARDLGERSIAYVARYNLAMIAASRAEHGSATRLLRESLRSARDLRDAAHIAHALRALAGIAAAQRQPLRAARLWGASATLLAVPERRAVIYAADPATEEAALQAARAQADPGHFAAALAEGHAMRLDDAVAYALDEW